MRKYHGAGLFKAGFIGAVLIVLVILVGLSPERLISMATAVRYQALFSEAGGLAAGNPVTVSGIKVGSVSNVALRNGDALVTFTIKANIPLGSETTAHIRTGTLLGERMLTLDSAGSGTMHPMALIPVSRTSSPYSLTEAVSDFTASAADTSTATLNQSLDTLSATLNQIAPQLGPTFDELTRLSRTLNGRNKTLGDLFKSASDVTGVLSERSQQVNKLILNSDDLLRVLVARRQEIVDLLANTSVVAKQLTGLVHDNESKLAPTLKRLNSVTAMLEKNRDNISKALPGLAKFQITVGEAISSMYAYSAFVPNLAIPQLFQPFLDYLWGFRNFDTARGPGYPSPVPRTLIPWPYNGIPVCPECTLGGRVGGTQ
ncbi:mammalian cell entry protein [Mycobacterium sp. 1164966.3]|uniref:MCE family protein n=1 Tax=Mycobacterium sp. 1164966.3 TaxID=1856861 RepID=UPI0008001E9E|nr:MCE family protein [Mycobacterium sp. 1164966.3]OBA84345.1 mammalian cell entry protein [Mycobacterium sp. 1164966.3]